MKRITIFQEGSSPIAIDDSDEQKIEQYTRELSKLLESNNVAILHTTSSSIIIRPNKISSIVVSDMGPPTSSKRESKEYKQRHQLQKQPEEAKKSNEKEAIENSITD